MAERHRPAVHVHARPIPPECFAVGERLDRERFVRFDQIVIGNLGIGACQQILYRNNGSKKQILGLSTTARIPRDSRQRFHPMSLCERQRRHHERACPIIESRSVAWRHRAILLERRFQRGERLERRVFARTFIFIDDPHAVLAGNLDRHRLGLEEARLHRANGLLMALQREFILLTARDAGLLRRILGEVAHVRVGERIPQPVANHAVHELRVAGLDPAAHAIDVVRRGRHRLEPAGHD